jgi:hypothetical protein
MAKVDIRAPSCALVQGRRDDLQGCALQHDQNLPALQQPREPTAVAIALHTIECESRRFAMHRHLRPRVRALRHLENPALAQRTRRTKGTMLSSLLKFPPLYSLSFPTVL